VRHDAIVIDIGEGHRKGDAPAAAGSQLANSMQGRVAAQEIRIAAAEMRPADRTAANECRNVRIVFVPNRARNEFEQAAAAGRGTIDDEDERVGIVVPMPAVRIPRVREHAEDEAFGLVGAPPHRPARERCHEGQYRFGGIQPWQQSSVSRDHRLSDDLHPPRRIAGYADRDVPPQRRRRHQVVRFTPKTFFPDWLDEPAERHPAVAPKRAGKPVALGKQFRRAHGECRLERTCFSLCRCAHRRRRYRPARRLACCRWRPTATVRIDGEEGDMVEFRGYVRDH